MYSEMWQGRWKQYRGKIKQAWGSLTDDRMLVFSGQQDNINGRIQEHAARARRSRPPESIAALRFLK